MFSPFERMPLLFGKGPRVESVRFHQEDLSPQWRAISLFCYLAGLEKSYRHHQTKKPRTGQKRGGTTFSNPLMENAPPLSNWYSSRRKIREFCFATMSKQQV